VNDSERNVAFDFWNLIWKKMRDYPKTGK